MRQLRGKTKSGIYARQLLGETNYEDMSESEKADYFPRSEQMLGAIQVVLKDSNAYYKVADLEVDRECELKEGLLTGAEYAWVVLSEKFQELTEAEEEDLMDVLLHTQAPESATACIDYCHFRSQVGRW